MIGLRFLGALAVAAVLHLVGTAAVPWFPLVVDPFIVVLVWYAQRLGSNGAQLAGTATGLAQDALSGGLFGLHAFADTLVGYLVVLASQHVVVGQQGVRVLFFAAASAVQQGVAMLLVFLLAPRPELPPARWFVIKVAVTALLGGLVLVLESQTSVRWRGWKKSRSRRLRFR